MVCKRFLIASAATFCGTVSASATETVTYTYDVHGRVVEVKHSGGVNANAEIDYTYDKAENRVSVIVASSPNSPPP